MILCKEGRRLVKKQTKEEDVINRMLEQIDFCGMTAEELAGENGLLIQLISRFYSQALSIPVVNAFDKTLS